MDKLNTSYPGPYAGFQVGGGGGGGGGAGI